MGRFYRLRHIQTLDPTQDFERIFRLDTQYELPLEYVIGLEIAQVHTFAIPSIGSLLASTGEFTQRPEKRSDDTGLMLLEPLVHGFASDRGKQAVRRINRAHAPYDISQDDFRYVLATFAVIHVRMTDIYGWRPFSAVERDAIYHYYRRLGEHMAIKDIPSSYQQLSAYLDDYEAAHLGYSDGGHRVAMANRARMARDLFPYLPRRLALTAVDVLTPHHVRRALDLPEPSTASRFLVTTAFRARRALLRHAPARTTPVELINSLPWRRSYPHGYTIDQLGPTPPPAASPHDPNPDPAPLRPASSNKTS